LSTLALADWPDWRGPNADGHTDATGLPLTWSETENVLWKTEIHDLGHSTPVVWGDQIWLTTAKKDGSVLYAVCVDLNSGKITHDVPVFEVAAPQHINPLNSYATPSAVIEAGLSASTRPGGRPLLNSASVERMDVLEIGREHDCSLVVTAAGRGSLPSDAPGRIANATEIVEAALAQEIAAERLHVDPHVLPVAVHPGHGTTYLEAVRGLRSRFGQAVHVTGGLSNVSFGLPARRLLNDVFIDLAVEAGADSGIVDPVASDLARVFALDRTSDSYRLASDLLLGRDLYGADFMSAYRRGEVAVAVG
jgi:cobalamin-dependent methionine synthase I